MNQTTPAKLERRARALLRAYPAEYRRRRAEEIIDTLLEATPDGLAYPSARDSWALIAGGLRARAVRNREEDAATSLRLALLLGVALFLSFSINYSVVMQGLGSGGVGSQWLIAGACLLSTATGLVPWLRGRAVMAALVAPVGALLVIVVIVPRWHILNWAQVSWMAWILVALGVLAALSGRPSRLPGSWLWLLAAAPAASVAARLIPTADIFSRENLDLYLIGYAALLLAVVVTCWLVTDARPACALSIAVLLAILQYGTAVTVPGTGLTAVALLTVVVLPITVGLAVALSMLRLLYRRAAPAPPPLP